MFMELINLEGLKNILVPEPSLNTYEKLEVYKC
jgi:hypothetical protein